MKKIVKFRYFQNYREIKGFEPKKSHLSVELDELILKMYRVWEFEAVFHKIIEENGENF